MSPFSRVLVMFFCQLLLLVGVCCPTALVLGRSVAKSKKTDTKTDVVSHGSAHSKHAAASLSAKEGSPGYDGSR
jgi:hypothetical protein